MKTSIGDKNDDNNWLDEIVLKESIEKLNDREKKMSWRTG